MHEVKVTLGEQRRPNVGEFFCTLCESGKLPKTVPVFQRIDADMSKFLFTGTNYAFGCVNVLNGGCSTVLLVI